jgi:hypothetical protein
MDSLERKAVIDRIEDGRWAVLLIGQDEEEKVIPVEQLPQDAKEGTRLRLRLEKDVIQEIIVDAEETRALRSRVSSKMDKLRSRQRRFKPIERSQVQRREAEASDKPEASGTAQATDKQETAEMPEASGNQEMSDESQWIAPEQNDEFRDWEGYE